MASQPTRSAFSLAKTAVRFYYCIAVVSSNLIDLTGSDGVGLKFGDRISPRHRPFVELELNSTLSRSSRSDISDVASKKINIKNSYLRVNHPTTDSVYYNGDDDASISKESDRLVTVTRSEAVIFANKNHNLGLNRKSDEDVVRVPKNVRLPVIGSGLDDTHSNVSAQAHRLEMSTEFFVVPSTASSITRSTSVRPGGVILASKPTSNPTNNRIVTPPTIISTNPSGLLRKEPWVLPVLVLSSIAMIMMAAFEIFVLCKAWRTSPSRRHLFLGQMLLLGLFSCAGLAAILTGEINIPIHTLILILIVIFAVNSYPNITLMCCSSIWSRRGLRFSLRFLISKMCLFNQPQ